MEKDHQSPDLDPRLVRRVKAHGKRRCPHCQSSKWRWLSAVPISPEELLRYLLVRYRCEKCGSEFLVEEAKRSRLVDSAERCVHCRSRDVEKCSRAGADIEL
jgi:transposase-like protein